MFSLIYESTINPEGYDDLIDAWHRFLDSQDLLSEYSTPASDSFSLSGEWAEIEDHLNRAEAILDQIGRPSTEKADPALKARLDLVVNEDGRIISTNDVADAHFGTDMALSDIFDASDADSAIRLKGALRKIQEHREGQFVTLITLPADETRQKPTLYLTVSAASELAGRRKVLRLRSLAIPWNQKLGSELAAIFQLTPAETELSELLVRGNSVGQIAQLKNRSIETIRVQLKAVFRKTYSKTQTDLVRTILMFSVVIAQAQAKHGLAYTEERLDHIVLPDGRRMSILCFGDDNGAPVLFLHGMLDAFGGPMQMDQTLAQAGLKFICPARAGFGDSSPIRCAGQNAKRQVTEDLLYLADRLALKNFVILGHLAGSAYAYPLASAAGPRATALVSISGAVPIRSVRQIQAMSLRQKIVALTARLRPEFLPPLLRIGMSQIDSDQYFRFLHALFERGSVDRKLIESRALYDLLASQYRWSVLQGYDGFRLDASVVTTNWFRDVSAWDCRTTLMHGAHDPVVQHHSARAFAADLPQADFISFPDGGQLLLYQYPERVISTIVENL